MRYPVNLTPLLLSILTLAGLALGCGGSTLSPGRVAYEQTAPDHWSASVEDASATPSEGVTVKLRELRVTRAGDAYSTAAGLGVLKDDVTVDVAAALDLGALGGDASLSASVVPTEGRSVSIETDASWASPVADALDGGLMSLGTCAAIGTAEQPTEMCVRYEAGTMGGQDSACVSYGAGVNLCFPLPSAWRSGGETGDAAPTPAEGAPADGGYPDALPVIDAAALDLDPPVLTTPTAPSPGPVLVRDAG